MKTYIATYTKVKKLFGRKMPYETGVTEIEANTFKEARAKLRETEGYNIQSIVLTEKR